MKLGIFSLFILIIGIMMSPFNSSKTKIKNIDKKGDEELQELLREGKKIQAIKKLREETGLGLKDAKEYIDILEREYFNKY